MEVPTTRATGRCGEQPVRRDHRDRSPPPGATPVRGPSARAGDRPRASRPTAAGRSRTRMPPGSGNDGRLQLAGLEREHLRRAIAVEVRVTGGVERLEAEVDRPATRLPGRGIELGPLRVDDQCDDRSLATRHDRDLAVEGIKRREGRTSRSTCSHSQGRDIVFGSSVRDHKARPVRPEIAAITRRPSWFLSNRVTLPSAPNRRGCRSGRRTRRRGRAGRGCRRRRPGPGPANR